MGIYTSVTCSACQRLVVLVWNVLTSFRVSIPFRETEIDHIHYVLLFTVADQKVVGLHVAMDEVVIVQKFKSLNHLVSEHHGSLDGELALAIVEEIL
jgi:hypothetical protein